MNDADWLDGERFHGSGRPVYDSPLGAVVNKRREHMAQVRYEAVHRNDAESGDRRGHGLAWGRWVFAEEPGLAEGLFESGFELMMDTRVAPNAAIGLHRHEATEEIYYVLEGELEMTTVAADGQETTAVLRPGDAHLVRRRQSHWGKAGPSGARFIAVAMRVRADPDRTD